MQKTASYLGVAPATLALLAALTLLAASAEHGHATRPARFGKNGSSTGRSPFIMTQAGIGQPEGISVRATDGARRHRHRHQLPRRERRLVQFGRALARGHLQDPDDTRTPTPAQFVASSSRLGSRRARGRGPGVDDDTATDVDSRAPERRDNDSRYKLNLAAQPQFSGCSAGISAMGDAAPHRTAPSAWPTSTALEPPRLREPGREQAAHFHLVHRRFDVKTFGVDARDQKRQRRDDRSASPEPTTRRNGQKATRSFFTMISGQPQPSRSTARISTPRPGTKSSIHAQFPRVAPAPACPRDRRQHAHLR